MSKLSFNISSSFFKWMRENLSQWTSCTASGQDGKKGNEKKGFDSLSKYAAFYSSFPHLYYVHIYPIMLSHSKEIFFYFSAITWRIFFHELEGDLRMECFSFILALLLKSSFVVSQEAAFYEHSFVLLAFLSVCVSLFFYGKTASAWMG